MSADTVEQTIDSIVAATPTRSEMIDIALIRPSDVALRSVKRDTEQYKQLLDSVKKKGVLCGVVVREQTDPVTKTNFYSLIDGLHRYTAACDAGVVQIPASIVSLSDAEVLEAQLITNLNRIDTKPADQSKHLMRMLQLNPMMTKAALASKVCQSLTWVEERLGLDDLIPEAKELVNSGVMHLTNAYMLSRLPENEQTDNLQNAKDESPKTFVPRMKQRLKDIRDAAKAGKDAAPATYQPAQFLQKVNTFKTELENCQVGSMLIAKHNIKTPEEAWKMAIAWALNYDPDSQAEQTRNHEAKEAERKAKAEKNKAEREAKEKAKAEANAADITKGGW